jgi:hypothetical protein
MGSFPSARQAQFYKIAVTTSGSLTVTRYGSVAQTAGDATNYVDFEGISYAVS